MPSLAGLHPEFRPWVEYLIRAIQSSGQRVQVTSALRTRAQQALLYQRYQACSRHPCPPGYHPAINHSGVFECDSDRTPARDLKRCLPAVPPGTSDHEAGLAVDLVVNGNIDDPWQAAAGRFWQSLGGRWGGDRDPVHFAA